MPTDRLNGPVGNGKGSSAGDHSHGTHGLMQLCVIVEKDEVGYGLTVSGDKPVHVQSVKENGASARAGVRTGDRIYKVNGSLVANFDHTEVVSLIKAGSHVALTLLRRPEREHQKLIKTPTSPGGLSVSSSKSTSGGSDRITHPIPADAHQEQQAARERIDTVRRMLDEAVANENKLQQEYSRSKSQKADNKLQDAKKTTGHIRKQLESLTSSPYDMRAASNRNSVCLGDVTSWTGDTLQSPAVSLPASVDSPDSSVVRSPAVSTQGEYTYTASPSDTDEESTPYSRMSSGEHRNSLGFGRVSQNPSSDIFSMDDDDFSPESQTVVKDHGPFIDFELLRNRHAHCSVFLSFLVSNADPAPMLFTHASELYMNGSAKDMRRWAYEIHSTFILKDAPLAIKLEDSIIESIEYILKTNSEKEDHWKNLFTKARSSAAEDITAALADFRLKRELGLGNLFGDGDLRDDIDKSTELRIIEKTLKPHYDKYASDESPRSQAMSISLATVMKEWGVHKGGIDRQVSFAMKDYNKSSIKSVLGSKFNKKQKETKNHLFTPHMYQATTFCDHCGSLIWGIGFQGYICSNCEMNIHKECFSQVDTCSKKKKKKRSSIIPKQMIKTSTSSTSSASMLADEMKDPPSATGEEELTAHSVAALKEKFEASAAQANNNGEQPKSSNVARSGSFNQTKSESIKSKDGRRAKSDVDKDGGEKILTAIGQSRSSSSASSLSMRSDSSSTEKVNDLSMKPAPIDEEGDSDFDVEESMPPLDGVIKKEQIRKMKPKDKKRQEVINELLYTERSHVRNLKLLDKLFHQPMARADFCSKELVELVFPCITQLIEIHVQLNNELKSKMKEDPLVSIKDVATILLSRFDGEAGEKMKEICALFCRNHTYALNVLKERRKKDYKLQELMTAAETNPLCRRLQFKDLIIIEVHRLTKYPLLIDSMYNHTTSAQSEEHKMLARASKCSRAILEQVNHAVKECENHHKLVSLQRRLDTKPIQNSANPLVADYKNLNLQDYKLVYEGALTWRLSTNRTKQIELHVVLLEEMLVLLQVQDDGKLVLKCQSQIATQSQDSKFGHSPIITLNSMLVRQVATDKKAIFIINTSQLGPQIYDLVANSIEEKKRWFKYISEAAESQKKSSSNRHRAPVNKSNLTLTEVATDEPPVTLEGKLSDPFPSNAITTNNNGPSDDMELSSPSSKQDLLNDSDIPAHTKEPEDGGLNIEIESGVSTSETTLQDTEDGERDPKSLVLASISDTMLLKQFLSNAAASPSASAAAATAATVLSNATATPSPASSPATIEQTTIVLNTLSKRLNSLLEVVEEYGNERLRLQHQLHTAEQLLKHSPSKELADSRPNSFVSNSSSNTSAGETSDSQSNGNPVIPPVIQIERANSNNTTDSISNTDSDDEGTVYAEPKEDLNETGDETKQQRPDSSLSDISNTHTDNTLMSNDNLSDDLLEPTNKHGDSSDATSNFVTASEPRLNADDTSQIEDSMNSSLDVESYVEKTNIDDIVSATPGDIHTEADAHSRSGDEGDDMTASVAASIVDQAIKAAMVIMRDSTGEECSQFSSPSPTDFVNSNDIDVGFVSDNEVSVDEGGEDDRAKILVDKASDDIDDSDEGDALSASSLD